MQTRVYFVSRYNSVVFVTRTRKEAQEAQTKGHRRITHKEYKRLIAKNNLLEGA